MFLLSVTQKIGILYFPISKQVVVIFLAWYVSSLQNLLFCIGLNCIKLFALVRNHRKTSRWNFKEISRKLRILSKEFKEILMPKTGNFDLENGSTVSREGT
jgi:hypothetical protein